MSDQGWLNENVGPWLLRLFEQYLIFILGPNNEYIYGNVSGNAASPTIYSLFGADISRLIGLVRGQVSKRNNDHKRLPSQPVAENASMRTTAGAVHATDLASVAQQPTVVGVRSAKSSRERPIYRWRLFAQLLWGQPNGGAPLPFSPGTP